MAATALTNGSGDWGLESVETGIILNTISFQYTHQSATLEDITGNTESVTYYDEKVEISIEGEIPATSPFAGKLGNELTLLNAIPDHVRAGVAGGSVLIEDINVGHDRKGYKKVSVKATLFPNITVA